MKLKCMVFLIFVTSLVCLSSACHRRRKRRSSAPNYVAFGTVQSYFPTCMQNRALRSGVLQGRAWDGAVAFTLYHSQWYQAANSFCTFTGDSPECWMQQIGNLIDSSSPALRIAKQCILDYYRFTTRSTKTFLDPPTPPPRPDAGTCSTVDMTTYKNELRQNLNIAEFATDDPVKNDLDGVLQFVQDDMICPDCSCEDLSDESDTEDFDFDDGKTCGSCWLTRLPTAVRRDSGFRRPARIVAKKRGGLRRRNKTRPNTNPGNFPPKIPRPNNQIFPSCCGKK